MIQNIKQSGFGCFLAWLVTLSPETERISIRPSFFYFLIYKPADCIICEKQIKIKHQHYSFIIFRPAVSTVSAASEIKVSGYTP